MTKRLLVLLVSIVAVFGLVACGETSSEEKEVSSVESSDKADNEEVEGDAEESDVEESEEAADYDEVLIDSDIATINLEGISKVSDDIFGDSHVIKVAIENKSDKVIVVQTDNVSIDGLMVTDNVFFSEEVAAGKKANGKIEIQMFDDEELPPLDEELEMLLLVIDEETYDRVIEEQININIK